MELTVIGRVFSDFSTKFGIPRQSGLVPSLESTLVFEPPFRSPEALRGLEDYSHLWLIWQFSENLDKGWRPTVRPPRLGGNARMGVFATRSPFRPNPLGLSCVTLAGIDWESAQGPVLRLRGADLISGTPVFDIKPYLPYADSVPAATGGFTDRQPWRKLTVCCPDALLAALPPEKRRALLDALACDPRPPYQRDPDRIYGLAFAGKEIRFSVAEQVLTVLEIM